MMTTWTGLRRWARAIKRDTVAAYLAVRDERTPWWAKAIGVVVVAYALSPIDLIPDFIPIIGYLDDLLLVPAGLWLVMRLVPAPVLVDCRARAAVMAERPVSWIGVAFVVAVWLVITLLAVRMLV
ncbi:MAG: DUF1232 domain-containing protein [Hyphomonadaceae bacterium]|nr:DUF1232 domain-containing protein [Hyphomonadaceae bacterium]